MTESGVVERQSDDGEPSGTAGGPLLNILNKNNLCNVLVIVTRYFGGILLGTGGLVRAYSSAAMEAIDKASLTNEILGIKIEVEINYPKLENLKYYCDKNLLNIVDIIYENTIKCYIELPKEKLNDVIDVNNGLEIISYKVLQDVNIRQKI